MSVFKPMEWAFGHLSVDMGIDLGTANTLVCARGRGIILNDLGRVAIGADPGSGGLRFRGEGIAHSYGERDWPGDSGAISSEVWLEKPKSNSPATTAVTISCPPGSGRSSTSRPSSAK